jgi:hypothetical protein
MSPLLALFSLGPTELVVLALGTFVVLAAGAAVVIVVLVTRRKKGDPDNE